MSKLVNSPMPPLLAASRADVELVASPCVSICAMDAASGLCAGCLRTLDEIASWSALDDDGKRAVLARLSARRARLAASDPESTSDPESASGPSAERGNDGVGARVSVPSAERG